MKKTWEGNLSGEKGLYREIGTRELSLEMGRISLEWEQMVGERH